MELKPFTQWLAEKGYPQPPADPGAKKASGSTSAAAPPPPVPPPPPSGKAIKIPTAASATPPPPPGPSRPWTTGMEHPAEERDMVRKLQDWVREVVMPFRGQFTMPAQVFLDTELQKVMHVGKGKSYFEVASRADEFSETVGAVLERGERTLTPSDFPYLHALSKVGLDLNDPKRRVDEKLQKTVREYTKLNQLDDEFAAALNESSAIHLFGRCGGPPVGPVKPLGRMRVHEASSVLFHAGDAGTGWVGICQMGRRCGQEVDTIYFIPNESVGSHWGPAHQDDTKKAVAPIEHGFKGQTSHSGAIAAIRDQWGFGIADDRWNGKKLSEWADEQQSGIFYGFSVVKAFNVLGHLYAWTSISTNRWGTSAYYNDRNEKDPRDEKDKSDPSRPHGVAKYGGETDVPLEWAVAIWRATRNLGAGSFKRV